MTEYEQRCLHHLHVLEEQGARTLHYLHQMDQLMRVLIDEVRTLKMGGNGEQQARPAQPNPARPVLNPLGRSRAS